MPNTQAPVKPPASRPWQAEPLSDVLLELDSSLEGLSELEAARRLAETGPNELNAKPPRTLAQMAREQLTDPMILILLVAAVLSALLQEWAEAGIIFAIVMVNAVIGIVQERKAQSSLEALRSMSAPEARVVRDGVEMVVPARDLVPGDLVQLGDGSMAPADLRLVEAAGLRMQEAALTGESVPVEKDASAVVLPGAPLGDRSNMAFATAIVTAGRGAGIVVATGMGTEVGHIAGMLEGDEELDTPIKRKLASFGKILTIVGVAAALAVLAVGLAYGRPFAPLLLLAVSLAISVIPESLPATATITMALGVQRMARHEALVRRLPAVETLGGATVICTDKTGTLTRNQMNVYKADFYGLGNAAPADGELDNLIREGIAVNSTAFLDYADPEHIKALGNPTEGALLLWLHGLGVNYLDLRENARVQEQLTFSTERKYMATVVESPLLVKKVLYVKGAPEIVLGLCSTVLTPEGQVPAADMRPAIEEQLLAYQNQAMRTLGFAYRILDDDAPVFEDGRVIRKDLVYLGIAAISDPVRDDVPQAVKDCMDAGINIKIVTGDTPGTAREIGRQIGLWTEADTPDRLMTGVEFEQTPDAELLDRVMDLKIMCRARPMDKERLVKLLQKKDQVVAVTGDGTNDAPALNAAQVGLSMGDGTTVAKEASAITILDNSFMSISRAVMWGRSLYRNIQRFIVFQMTINVAACLIVLIGAFLGTESPLTVTQMLWVNLIMDTFAALALASLPPDERVMQDPPRKTTDHIITRPMGRNILGVGILFVAFLFGLLQYFKHADVTSLTQFSLSGYFGSYLDFSSPEHELTGYELSLFFTIFVLLQFWNMFNAKAFNTHQSAFARMGASIGGFGVVALLILAGQYLIVTFGGKMFNVVPLSWTDWGIIFAGTSLVLWIGELVRAFTPDKSSARP